MMMELDKLNGHQESSASLQYLEFYLREQLVAWYYAGFLKMRRITWEDCPAATLEYVL